MLLALILIADAALIVGIVKHLDGRAAEPDPKVETLYSDGVIISNNAGIWLASTTTSSTEATLATTPPTLSVPTTLPASTTPPSAAPQSAAGRVVTVGSGRTACSRVAHIGDSLSTTMTSTKTPSSGRMDSHYRRVGVGDPLYDVAGGRSIIERVNGQPNGYEAALRFRQTGFAGCWVIALGVNDAANVAKGSSVDVRDRIVRMMSVIGSDPVMWINQRTTTNSGWWANKNMQAWNQVLLSLAPSYPNLRIFDWSSVSLDSWYASDGVHQTSTGSAHRASLTADALAAGFPSG